jgi:hypothetical protein
MLVYLRLVVDGYHFFFLFLIKILQLIRDLHNATTSNSEVDDQSQRGTQLLEIYALEIQMYNETRNFKKLKVSYLFMPTIRGASFMHRKFITLAMQCAQPFPILGSWVLSRNVVGRCGWVNVKIFHLFRTFNLLNHQQVNGTEPVKTSLSHFAITMKLGHHKGFKS